MADEPMSKEEVEKLVSALTALKLKLMSDSPEDLMTWMKECVGKTHGIKTESGDSGGTTQITPGAVGGTGTIVKVFDTPRLPYFSGEGSEDAVYDIWKYEVQCLFQDKLHTEDTIRQAIRRSLKGQAARVILRLGPQVDVPSILGKMDSIFGDVDAGETLLAKFYSARQKETETVATWALRLEDLLDQAIDAGDVPDLKQDQMLRSMLWTGLQSKLKDVSGHKYDQSHNFSELLVSLRRVEQEMKGRTTTTQKKTVNPGMAAVTSENKELSEIKGMIRKLSGEVADIKKKTDSPSRQPPQSLTAPPGTGYSSWNPPPQGPNRMPRQQRGPPAQFSTPPSVQGNYIQGAQPFNPRMPRSRQGWTTDAFGNPSPICYRCGQPGHLSYQSSVRLDHSWDPLN